MATIKVQKPLAAFLDLIARSEGTCSSPVTRADGYDVIVTGLSGPNVFTDYSGHPFAGGRPPILVRAAKDAIPAHPDPMDPQATIAAANAVSAIHSTASGRYQFILGTWDFLKATHKLGTFSPQFQDLAALHLLDECNATAPILALDIPTAIEKACKIWASFPGNLYNQGGRELSWLLANFQACMQAQS